MLFIACLVSFSSCVKEGGQQSSPRDDTQALFFFLSLFVFESEHEQGRDKERGRKRITSGVLTVSAEPDAGPDPSNCEIMA